MTALVVIERADLEAETTVSKTASLVSGGRLDLLPGERWTVRELLFALLLSSSNDAAVALAEHVSGDEGSFVTLMNETAERFGLRHSLYATSHGLDAAGHASSAEDLAELAAQLLDRPTLAQIVGSERAVLESSERTVEVENTNLLLETYRGATGVKTGFTALAGNVLVASAERYGRRLIAVAMHSDDAFEDSTKLLEHGFAKLARNVLLERQAVLGALIWDGVGTVRILSDGIIRGAELEASVDLDLRLAEDVFLPVRQGEEIGTIVVLNREGDEVGSAPAVAGSTLPSSHPDWRSDAITEVLAFAGRWFGD